MTTPGISSLPEPPDGDRNKGAAVIVMGICGGGLGFALVSMRLWARARIVKRLGLDDFFILLGLILMIAVLVIQGLMVKYGLGRHQYYLNLSPNLLEQEPKSVEWLYIGEAVFLASVMFTRISICLFLLHIFGTKKMWRWGLHSVIVCVIIIGLSTLIMVFFECHPVRKIWQPSHPGTCWRSEVALGVGGFNGAASVVCDWTLAALPIAFMWNIQISVRNKVGICILMGMGSFSGVCARFETALLFNAKKTQDASCKSTTAL
ncbi:hypothetical protein N7G274_007034 [Stereocaulon virgatum]|uniref:Rhodopsin domain-containing protein n=1 Tax=Stereocaulon virgatum TaxID=373712 RepID=A0ABR4A5D6_9LECA